MIDLGIKFPSEARQALDRARRCQAMTPTERFRALDDLAAFAEAVLASGENRDLRRALSDHLDLEEMEILADIQRRGHV